MLDDDDEIETLSKGGNFNDSKSDVIDETDVQEFPAMVGGTVPGEGSDEKKEEDKKEPFKVTVEQCEALYGCVLESIHGVVATGKGKPHRDIPAERRHAQAVVLHRLVEKYNIPIPEELDIVIMGASIVADWQYMGAGGTEDTEERVEEPVNTSTIINPEMGGVVTNDAKAVAENRGE